jgi:hypothetical protein
MKRSLISVAVIAIAAIGASAADAAFPARGTFTGKTELNDPFGFKVDTNGRVYSVWFEGVNLDCSDGDNFETPIGPPNDPDPDARRIQTPRRERFPVDSRRRWGVEARNRSQGNGYDVLGKLNAAGNRSVGTLRVFARFDEDNNPDPRGSVRCSSGELKTTATRRR